MPAVLCFEDRFACWMFVLTSFCSVAQSLALNVSRVHHLPKILQSHPSETHTTSRHDQNSMPNPCWHTGVFLPDRRHQAWEGVYAPPWQQLYMYTFHAAVRLACTYHIMDVCSQITLIDMAYIAQSEEHASDTCRLQSLMLLPFCQQSTMYLIHSIWAVGKQCCSQKALYKILFAICVAMEGVGHMTST